MTTASIKEVKNYSCVGKFASATSIHSDLANQNYDSAVKSIQELVKQVNIEDFVLDEGLYSRNILLENDAGWLGILNWDETSKTSIHGHPERAFVYVLCGKIEVKNYSNGVHAGTDTFTAGQYQYKTGEKGKFDNYVHQIKAIEPSLTLHFYSDNPAKGLQFDL